MAVTVASTIADIQVHFSGVSDTLALSLINKANEKIGSKVALNADTTVTLTLVADQDQYALDDTVMKIWNADYFTGASSSIRLRQVSMDWLDYTYPTWRTAPSGKPYVYYEHGGKIGLYPKPASATSGGYPIVKLYTQKSLGPLSSGDSLPGIVRTNSAWVYDACAQFAAMQHPDQIANFKALAADELSTLITYVNGRLARDKPTIQKRRAYVRNI